MAKKDTLKEIIRIGTEHISLQGFGATSIDALLKEAGVPKGSFYHYFKSKEDFGLAVIDHFAERFEQRLDIFLNDEEVAPLDCIRNFLENAQARIVQNQCNKGCLLGNLGLEMADLNERFRSCLDEIFHKWQERFAECLRRAQATGGISAEIDPGIMACFILSGWEGAILRAKVMKSPQPMKDFITVLFGSTLR
jgi:TetR/AcrR family transcriptional regulator, transcriptional repressor for nem operon